MIHKTAKVHKTAVIYDGVIIGANSIIGANAVIGGPPEHRDHLRGSKFSVHVGDNTYVGNGVTIDSGTIDHTLVGSHCTLLRNAHVGHDAVISDHVTLSCNVLIGGHTIVFPFANCGLGAIVHQNTVIGSGAMLGMGTIVTKATKIESFNIYVGNPARFLKANSVGLERSGLSTEQLRELVDAYNRLIRPKTS